MNPFEKSGERYNHSDESLEEPVIVICEAKEPLGSSDGSGTMLLHAYPSDNDM